MGVCGGNSLCCVLFLFGVFDNMPPISGLIRLLRTPFGRALTSSLIEPLVLRLPASERWRAVRRGWVWVLCGFFVIPRSDSEEAAATAWRPAGKGHSDSVVPLAVVECFFGVIQLPRLPASERWRAMRRGWVWVLCGFFVIPRSDSEGVPPLSPPRQRSG